MGQSDLIVFSSGDLRVSEELERGYSRIAVVSNSNDEKFNDMLWDYKEQKLIDILIFISGEYEQEHAIEFLDKLMYSDTLIVKEI